MIAGMTWDKSEKVHRHCQFLPVPLYSSRERGYFYIASHGSVNSRGQITIANEAQFSLEYTGRTLYSLCIDIDRTCDSGYGHLMPVAATMSMCFADNDDVRHTPNYAKQTLDNNTRCTRCELVLMLLLAGVSVH